MQSLFTESKSDSNPLCGSFMYPLVLPRAFPYFTSLELILAAVTFFWYGGEKRPHSQLLFGETRAAACQPATTQPHTVGFSVPHIQGRDCTQDIQNHKLSFPCAYFCLICCQCTRRSSHLKVKWIK